MSKDFNVTKILYNRFYNRIIYVFFSDSYSTMAVKFIIFIGLFIFISNSKAMKHKNTWCFQMPIIKYKEVIAGCRADLAQLIADSPGHPLREVFAQFYCQCELHQDDFEVCKSVVQTESSWCCGPL